MSITYNTSIVRNGLVLQLDTANVKSYPGSGTVWNNLGTNSYSSTLTNGPVFSSQNAGCLIMDGVDDYVDVAFSESQLNFSNGFTWSTVVYVDEVTTNPFTNFMSTYIGTPVGTSTAMKVSSPSAGSSRFEFRSYGLNLIRTSNNLLPLQTWIMITAVWNPAGSYQLYENDQLANSGSTQTTYAPSTGGSLRIAGGAVGMGNPAYLKGKLSISQVYNRALSATEVSQNFNAIRGRYGI